MAAVWSDLPQGGGDCAERLIGQVTHVEVGLPGGNGDFDGVQKAELARLAAAGIMVKSVEEIVPGTKAWDMLISEPPPELDYETWLGPSEAQPYMKVRGDKTWRWNYNTGGGELLDWIGHHCDIAHWGLGFDYNGPSEVEGSGALPPTKACGIRHRSSRFELKYPQNITMTIASSGGDIKPGVKWIGTRAGCGWIAAGLIRRTRTGSRASISRENCGRSNFIRPTITGRIFWIA